MSLKKIKSYFHNVVVQKLLVENNSLCCTSRIKQKIVFLVHFLLESLQLLVLNLLSHVNKIFLKLNVCVENAAFDFQFGFCNVFVLSFLSLAFIRFKIR